MADKKITQLNALLEVTWRRQTLRRLQIYRPMKLKGHDPDLVRPVFG